LQFAHRLSVLRQRLLGRFVEFVFQEQVPRRIGRLDFQPAVFVSNFVALPIDLRDETFLEEAFGAFQRGLGLAQFFLRHLQVVLELADFLFRFAIPQRLDLRVFGEINDDGWLGRRVRRRAWFWTRQLPGLIRLQGFGGRLCHQHGWRRSLDAAAQFDRLWRVAGVL